MTEILQILKLKSEGNSQSEMLLVLALLASVIWLARQYFKLRSEINDIKNGEGQQSRNAVIDAMEKVVALQGKGLNAHEFEMAKAQILSTIHFDQSKTRDQNQQSDAATVQITQEDPNTDFPLEPTSRLGRLVSSLFAFGFFGIWGLGWGSATVGFFSSSMFDLWDWAMVPFATGEALHFIGRVAMTVLIILAVAGLGIVPTIMAALASVWSLSTMIGTIVPNRLTDAIDRALVSARDKHIGNSN